MDNLKPTANCLTAQFCNRNPKTKMLCYRRSTNSPLAGPMYNAFKEGRECVSGRPHGTTGTVTCSGTSNVLRSPEDEGACKQGLDLVGNHGLRSYVRGPNG